MELTYTLPLYTGLLATVGLIRLAELLLSRRNRGRMRARGASAVPEPHFAAMVLVHAGILLGSGLEAWLRQKPVSPVLALPMLAVLLASMGLRWWTIRSLGAHWNVAIMDSIDSDGRGLIVATGGPFRWIRHPNYLAVFCELLALPLLHAAWICAGLGTAAHLWVLYHRVRTEESVLLAHASYREAMGNRPRFIPAPLARGLRTLWAFVRLGRPLFLLGGLVMYGLGVAVALVEGAPWNASLYGLGQMAIACFQLMTHFANDYFDYEADKANTTPTRWTGGSRVLPRGELPRWSALLGAGLSVTAGLIIVAVLSFLRPLPLLWPLSLAIIVLAWFYSAPPLRLHSTGWGELDGTLVVTILVPLFGFCLHNPSLAGVGHLVLVMVPASLLQFSMLLAVAVPDAQGDALVGKKTLAVRLGVDQAMRWHGLLALAAFTALPLLTVLGLPARVGAVLLLLSPIAVWRGWSTLRAHELEEKGRRSLAFWATALFALAGLAEIAGLLLPLA
jgi:1,4-dihydroxy-2-naphthoate polyprenyltransferase